MAADQEERDDELVQREREREERTREDSRHDQRQDDAAQAVERVRSQVARRALERGIESLEPRRDEEQHERRRVDRLADDGCLRRELEVERAREQHEQAHADEQPRDHDRQRERDTNAAAERQPRAYERERGGGPDHGRDRRHLRGDLESRRERVLDLVVAEDLPVPVRRPARERQRPVLVGVEAEEDEKHARRAQEDLAEDRPAAEQRAHEPRVRRDDLELTHVSRPPRRATAGRRSGARR